MRFRYKVNVSVSNNESEQQDFGKPLVDQVTDTFNEGGSWRTKVAAGATNYPVSLGSLAETKFLLIRTFPVDLNNTPASITIKRNLITNEAIEIAPYPGNDNKEGIFILSTTGITALFATNASAIDVYIWLVAGGD